MNLLNRINISLVFVLSTLPIIAQTSNAEQYQRASAFVWDSLAQKTYNLTVKPYWYTNSAGMAYQLASPQGKQYIQIDFKKMEKKEVDLNRLKNELQKLSGHKIRPGKDLPIRILNWKKTDEFDFEFESNRYQINLKNHKITAIQPKKQKEDTAVSPNGKYEVFIKDYNLVLREVDTGKEQLLTQNGNREYMYGSAYGWSQTVKGENTPPEPRLEVKWSPDSKKILTQISDFSQAEKMYLLDWSIDSLYRPELMSYYRPSPGDSTFVKLIPLLIDADTKKVTQIDLTPQPHMLDLGDNLYWMKNGQKLYGTYDHRGFQQKDILEVDAENGNIKVVYSDKSDTNIDYNAQFRFTENLQMALFTSERTGWKQLYKLDWQTGKVSALTNGQFVVNEIKDIDEENAQVYFMASGKDKNRNPYYQQLYRVDLNGKGLELLTEEPYHHEVYISPDHLYFVDNISTANRPTQTYLRSTENGKKLIEMSRGDVSELQAMGWDFPVIFETLAKDHETKIYGAFWKPTHFDPAKSYPIVEYSYTGPHMNVFPNSFVKGIYGLYNSPQALAELGFIVVQIDGRGSAGRSKAFHNKSYKNLGKNLEDHVMALQYLADKYPFIDGSRVGIFGHSFGGYDAAHALLEYNNTYKVAVSESADHDWRMEKAWYPELYAGWPVDESYDEQSNITMAHLLKGSLLLIHGGIDENVNPSATFKLSEALIKADKYFDLLIVPSSRHAIPKAYYSYVQKKRWMFFVKHLIIDPQ